MTAEWISSKVRAAAVERKLEAGKALFHAGSKTVGLYEVLNGTVCLVRTDRSGREAILQRASTGDILAEASLFSSTYHCDAVAKTAATVTLYPKAILLAELQRDPRVAQAFAAMLAAGMAGVREDLDCGKEYSGNAYIDSALARLPIGLNDAATLFERSKLAKSAFGDSVVDFYVHHARLEIEAFNNAVTDWEKVRYFERI